MSFSKEQVCAIIDALKTEYPDAGCALKYRNPFQLVIAVTLSAQTTDKSVNKVTPQLFDKFPTPESLANADQNDVINCIRTIGMYKTKSKNLMAMARKLCDEFDGQVPENYDQLITLPGVGRKTANVVLAEAFGVQRIPVDTHVFRVTNRIGLVSEKDVLKTEQALMKVLPDDRWIETHHTFIFHGRNCCSARNPRCNECCIGKLCKKVGVDK